MTGCTIRFTDEFLQNMPQEHHWNYHELFDQPWSNEPRLASEAESIALEQMAGLLAVEYAQLIRPRQGAIVRHLLEAFLMKISSLEIQPIGFVDTRKTASGEAQYQAFLRLLETQFCLHHEVAYYARQLNLTAGQLSNIVQSITMKPAKRIILERIFLEAKRHLQFTQLSVKEIAMLIGYRDPYHFSKVFKQETGLSPQLYRTHWIV